MSKFLNICAFLLIAIILTGAVGINILSYCCNHKEVSMLLANDRCCSGESHLHTSQCDSSCQCWASSDEGHKCASSAMNSLDEHEAVVYSNCVTSSYLHLTPVKITEFVFALSPPIAIVVELFNFVPLSNYNFSSEYVAYIPPPHSTGRVVLAKHSTFLI